MEIAKGSSKVIDDGGTDITECRICWNTKDSLPSYPDNHIKNVVSNKDISCIITGLNADTQYYVWAYAENKIGRSYSLVSTRFKTPTLPTVITNTPSQIKDTSVLCGGNVINEGGVPVEERGVCWSNVSKEPSLADSYMAASSAGIGNYSFIVTGLEPGTKYYVRAYARNSVGTGYGNLDSLKTIDIPTVITIIPREITSNSALGGGEITDNGGLSIISRGVCWSKEKNPTIDCVTKTKDGQGDGIFESKIGGLERVSKYYIRAYATNSFGIGYGELDSIITHPELPQVSNVAFGEKINESVSLRAEVLDDGGVEIISRGFCWSTSGEPDVDDNLIKVGAGLGEFTESLEGLVEGKIYYVRAFVTTRAGTAYSERVKSYTVCPTEF